MTKIKTLLFACCAFLVQIGLCQNPTYLLNVTNESLTNANTYEFDVFLLRTGSTTFELAGFQLGLGIDTNAINGGTLSPSIIAGTSELPASQIPLTIAMGNVNFTSTTAICGSCNGTGIVYTYMNVAARPGPGTGNGAIISNINSGCAHPGTKIGRFRIRNSVNFDVNSRMNLVWSASSASGRTNTIVTAYVAGINVPIINVSSNLNWNSSGTCSSNPLLNGGCSLPPVAKANGPYTSCGNIILNGAINGSATTGTWSSTTGGAFSPNATVLNATYIPTAAEIASGIISLTLITNNPNGFPCVSDTDVAKITFVSCNDNDLCTVDACSPSGNCLHNPINIDDNNVCTTDACDHLSGVSHTVINTDDGNPCTTDGCNPITGVFHNPVVISITGAMSGSTGACVPVSGQVYSIPSQTAVTLAWTVPLNVTIASGQGTTSISTNWASTATTGTVCVTASNTCGTSVPLCKTVTKRTVVPGTVGVISGSTVGCPGDVKLYSVRKLAAADLYTWTPPLGAKINGSTLPFTTVDTMVNVSFTATYSGDTLRVVGVNCKGISVTQRKLRISNALPATPGTITGKTSALCNSTGIVYSIAGVTNATTYTWATAIAGVTINGNPSPVTTSSTSVTLNFGASGTGTLTVKANNGCGSSALKSLTLASTVPSQPSAITGDAFGVCSLTAVPYSIVNVAGMTYNWSFSVAGATIASGQGTNAVTANYSATYVTGSITVSAMNGCGTSSLRTKIIKAAPATATTITGSTAVCINQQGVPYSITPLTSATSYVWTGPTASHIVANGTVSAGNSITTTANSVTVNYGTTAGTVKVSGQNNCGTGSAKSITITFVCRDEQLLVVNSFDASVYPNPTSGSFNIALFNKGSLPVIINLTDVTGRIIETINTNEESIELNKPELSKGIYFLRIIQGDAVLVKQLTLVK